jgi:hypothetical protein
MSQAGVEQGSIGRPQCIPYWSLALGVTSPSAMVNVKRVMWLSPVFRDDLEGTEVKLTRFRGHPNICVQGAHDGEDETTL